MSAMQCKIEVGETGPPPIGSRGEGGEGFEYGGSCTNTPSVDENSENILNKACEGWRFQVALSFKLMKPHPCN